jgi:hypothetical protein
MYDPDSILSSDFTEDPTSAKSILQDYRDGLNELQDALRERHKVLLELKALLGLYEIDKDK